MRQLLMACILIMASCNEVKRDSIKAFIPGTYLRKFNTEYSIGNDTLFITILNDNIYRVIKSSSFNRIRNGSTMPLESRSETWTAIWNKDEQVLHETSKGKIISFFPVKNMLMVGGSQYDKIKN